MRKKLIPTNKTEFDLICICQILEIKKTITDGQEYLMIGYKIKKQIPISNHQESWKCNNCHDPRRYF